MLLYGNIMELEVRVGSATSPSRYLRGLLLKVISTSRSTSSSSPHIRNPPHPIVLFRAFFTKPTTRSNCPPHHGARLRLNCQTIWFSARNILNFSSHVAFFNHRAAPTNVVPLSEYIFFGSPFLAINLFKLRMNSLVSSEGTRSRYKARHREHANSTM